jgi:uncharacterized protein (TIGR02001 family)
VFLPPFKKRFPETEKLRGTLMNNSTKLLCKTALASILVATNHQASAEKKFEFGADVALTTDLVLRGMSYTNEEPAIHGGFDIEHQTGVYVQTWAANVNLLEGDTVKPEDRANMVLGLYAGYKGDLNDNLSYDIQAAHYLFLGAAEDLNYDMSEFTANFTYSIQDTDLGLLYAFSPEFFLKSGKAHYYELTVSHSFANDLGIGGQLGLQTVSDNDTVGFEDYTYYGLWLSYPIGDFDTTLGYSNTDLDNADDLNADGRVYFTLSKSF